MPRTLPFLLIVGPLTFTPLPAGAADFKLADGDRVVLVGNTLIAGEKEMNRTRTSRKGAKTQRKTARGVALGFFFAFFLCAFASLRETPLHVRVLHSATGVSFWLDGVPVAVKQEMVLDLASGLRTLTFALDLTQRRDGLRCELDDVANSPARVRIVGGK